MTGGFTLTAKPSKKVVLRVTCRGLQLRSNTDFGGGSPTRPVLNGGVGETPAAVGSPSDGHQHHIRNQQQATSKSKNVGFYAVLFAFTPSAASYVSHPHLVRATSDGGGTQSRSDADDEDADDDDEAAIKAAEHSDGDIPEGPCHPHPPLSVLSATSARAVPNGFSLSPMSTCHARGEAIGRTEVVRVPFHCSSSRERTCMSTAVAGASASTPPPLSPATSSASSGNHANRITFAHTFEMDFHFESRQEYMITVFREEDVASQRNRQNSSDNYASICGACVFQLSRIICSPNGTQSFALVSPSGHTRGFIDVHFTEHAMAGRGRVAGRSFINSGGAGGASLSDGVAAVVRKEVVVPARAGGGVSPSSAGTAKSSSLPITSLSSFSSFPSLNYRDSVKIGFTVGNVRKSVLPFFGGKMSYFYTLSRVRSGGSGVGSRHHHGVCSGSAHSSSLSTIVTSSSTNSSAGGPAANGALPASLATLTGLRAPEKRVLLYRSEIVDSPPSPTTTPSMNAPSSTCASPTPTAAVFCVQSRIPLGDLIGHRGGGFDDDVLDFELFTTSSLGTAVKLGGLRCSFASIQHAAESRTPLRLTRKYSAGAASASSFDGNGLHVSCSAIPQSVTTGAHGGGGGGGVPPCTSLGDSSSIGLIPIATAAATATPTAAHHSHHSHQHHHTPPPPPRHVHQRTRSLDDALGMGRRSGGGVGENKAAETKTVVADVFVQLFDVKLAPTFTQSLSSGWSISTALAIDFSKAADDNQNSYYYANSNGGGFDTTPNSHGGDAVDSSDKKKAKKNNNHNHRRHALHVPNTPAAPNQYVSALMSVGDILSAYDTNARQIAVFGFGASVGDNKPSNFFSVNRKQTPFVAGVEGAVEAYNTFLPQCVHATGAANFAPTIGTVTAKARCLERSNVYTILVIVTEGVINDMRETMDALVAADDAPISVVIVGVGLSREFGKMQFLNGGAGVPLRSSVGRSSRRDLVQFVPYRDFLPPHPRDALAAEVLKKIPDQFEEYLLLAAHRQKREQRGLQPHLQQQKDSLSEADRYENRRQFGSPTALTPGDS